MTTGYLYSPVFLEHAEEEHPESPERLEEILRVLQESGVLKRLVAIEPQPATDEQIFAVHTRQHLARIERVISHARGTAHLDPDTYVNSRSLDAARLAAGAAVQAVDAVMSGKVDNVFALVRPPGHHATSGDAMGFCLLNNIAIGARHALDAYQLDRVLIVDFDVHHGNGTQDIFYNEPRVMFFSTHLYPFYPGTGNWNEIGTGDGMGYTVNVPLPASVGDEGYRKIFNELLFPLAERYRPEMIFVSAGFDAHWRDPMAMANLSLAGYISLMRRLTEMARELCYGRLVVMLEGGYDLGVLSEGVAATFRVLLGDKNIPDPIGPAPEPEVGLGGSLDHLKSIHRLV